MRIALVILTFALLLTACSRPGNQIVGTWKDRKNGTTTFSPDGTWRTLRGNGSNSYWFSGTWKIHNDTLSLTITNCSDTNWPWFGQTDEFHILNLQKHQLQFEKASPVITYKR